MRPETSPLEPDCGSLDRFADRLSLASERHAQSAFARIVFPETLESDKPLMPGGSLTLSEHDIYSTLSEKQRYEIGLLETVNFFSINIHGERSLMKELVDRLYRRRSPEESDSVSRYLQHFIHEENAHSYMLAEYCTRYHGRVMPEIVQPGPPLSLSKEGTDLLFFTRVYVLETLLDHVNTMCMRDESLDRTTRAIHRSHHIDEARHMAFDKAIISHLMQRMKAKNAEDEIQAIGTQVFDYGRCASSQFVSPRVYRECGISQALELSRDIIASSAWRTKMGPWTSRVHGFFNSVGLYAEPS